MDAQRDLHDIAVLAVDDLEDNLDLLEEFLEDEVWSVLRATGGEEAIRLAREHNPDVILLDLMMPRMNGLAILRTIRSIENLSEIGVILQTAYADKDNVVTAQRLGCRHILGKPLSKDRLLAEIRACLRGRAPRLRLPPAPPENPATARDVTEVLSAARMEIEDRGLVGTLLDEQADRCLRTLVAADGRIGQRLIRVANSPFYGGRNPVRTVSAALVRIGLTAAEELIRKASPAMRGGMTMELIERVLHVIEILSAAFGEQPSDPQALLALVAQLRKEFAAEPPPQPAQPGVSA